ncbi:MAG: MFS transporter, partial [Candidatus Bathyarchaeia archaeon]
FLLAGAETGAIDATERSYAAELLEENRRGTGFGILSTINGIGDFTSSITAGILWTLISASASFAFGATLALAATAILITRK